MRTAALTCLFLSCSLAAQDEVPPLRLVTYNVHGFGPVAATDSGREVVRQVRRHDQVVRRIALELQLHRPDVIALQEAVPEERVAELARELGMRHVFFPGGWKGEGWPRGIAGAVLTRFPIVEAQDCPLPAGVTRDEDLFSRFMGRVLLDVDGTQVAVFAAHMLPAWKNTTHIRLREIDTLVRVARADREAGRPVVVLGDLNHRPDTAEYRAWREAGLVDAFARAGEGAGLTCPSQEPTERIDYVWLWGAWADRVVTCRPLAERSFAVQAEDPGSFALSDHLPVLAIIR